MVLCVTLNPALQRTLLVTGPKWGEVHKASQAWIDPSGKALNTARSLRFLGEDAQAFTFWGGGTGTDFLALCQAQEIPVHGVSQGSPTRICTTVFDPSKGSTTEFVEPGHAADEFPLEDFLKRFRKSLRKARLVLFSGSRAQGLPSDTYQILADICRQEKVSFWVDLQGADLLGVLPLGPDLVKINAQEFDQAFSPEIELKTAARKSLLAKTAQETGLKFIITQGKGPVLTAWGSEVRDFPTSALDSVKITTGCGDSFFAGAALGHLNGGSWDQVVEWGQAAAARSAQTFRPGWLSETWPSKNLGNPR